MLLLIPPANRPSLHRFLVSNRIIGHGGRFHCGQVDPRFLPRISPPVSTQRGDRAASRWHANMEGKSRHGIRSLLLVETGRISRAAQVQCGPWKMHRVCYCITVFSWILWFVDPNPSGLHHWHWGNLVIAPVPVKPSWRIWVKFVCNCEYQANTGTMETMKYAHSFGCTLFCIIVVSWFLWSIYPYHSGLHHWHWGNH